MAWSAATVAAWLFVSFEGLSTQAQHAPDHDGHWHNGHGPQGQTAPAPRPSNAGTTSRSNRQQANAPNPAPHEPWHVAPPPVAPHPLHHLPPGVYDAAQNAQRQNHAHGSHAGMRGSLGPYPMTREGAGTSWLPDTTPHSGIHAQVGGWTTMWHAVINGVYDSQGGPRGDRMAFVNGMVMGMAQREMGNSTFGVRAMLSPDPFMGRTGYPLLLATGETADGRTHLIDRQHPHELFMELAATWSYRFSNWSSIFIYAGLPGEPALGPAAFMHRTSGMPNPEAPITHHWLDSTHITFGVVTAGLVLDRFKLETSAFRGREPDKDRYDIETPKLDSVAVRATWNPFDALSMQVSWGRLRSPEALVPAVDEDRITASLTYTQPLAEDMLWSTTVAWGRKIKRPGNTLDGLLLESALTVRNLTAFVRAEQVANDELRERGMVVDPLEPPGPADKVRKISVGGVFDFARTGPVRFGVGALTSWYLLPEDLAIEYGRPRSHMAFVRMKVQ